MKDVGQEFETNEVGLIDLTRTAALFRNRNTLSSDPDMAISEKAGQLTQDKPETLEMPTKPKTGDGSRKSRISGAIKEVSTLSQEESRLTNHHLKFRAEKDSKDRLASTSYFQKRNSSNN